MLVEFRFPGFLFPVVARHPLAVEPMGAFFQQLALPLADLVRMHSVGAGQLIERLLLFGRFQRQPELERAGVAIPFLRHGQPPRVG